MGDLILEIRTILAGAGLHTAVAFPSFRLPRLIQPMVAVGHSDIHILPCGNSRYLGVCTNGNAFGGEIEFVIQCDIYSPYRKDGKVCLEAVKTTLAASAAGLDSCTLKAMNATPIFFDENCDCFRASVRLTFGALLYESES